MTIIIFKSRQILWTFSGLVLCFLSGLPAHAKTIDLSGYQRSDGAITLYYKGDYIDPYFVNKALAIAYSEGFDIKTNAGAWIEWVLPRQHNNGLFGRFCIENEVYTECEAADADDSMLASWIELMVATSGGTDLNGRFKKSWRISLDYLHRNLLDQKSGLYVVSRENQVSLLMDNVEIYNALVSNQRYLEDIGDIEGAYLLKERISNLEKSLLFTFWDSKANYFRVSTQVSERSSFYPYQVAQIFPFLSEIRKPLDDAAFYKNWMDQNKRLWLLNGEMDFPWGLIALVAKKMNDSKTVVCWMLYAESLRHSDNWNILEEIVFQVLIDYSRNITEQGVTECLT